MPVLIFERREDIPQPLQTFENDIVETDGKWQVKVEPASKLAEFRDNNVKVLKERDTLAQRIERMSKIVGDDPDAFETQLGELRQTKQAVEDGQLVKAEGFQEALSKRTTELQQGFEKQHKEALTAKQQAEERAKTFEQRWRQSIIDRTLMGAITDPKLGVRPEAFEDIRERAGRVFRVHDDGKVVPYEGDTILYGADVTSPMSMKEWIARLREKVPYYYKDTTGGGAGGGGEGPSRTFKVRSKSELQTPAEKSKFISEHGLAAWEALPPKPVATTTS
jgi:hypothetical protein